MKTAALLLASSFVLASVVACSGAADSDLFGDQPASSTNGTDPGNGSSSNGSGGVASASSSSGGSSTSSGGSSTSSSSSSSSSGGSSSGGSSSGGSSSGGSSSGGSSSGGTWTSPGVYCGNQGGGDVYCTTHTQVCCLQRDFGGGGGGDGNFSQTCENNGIAACATGLAIECDDKTDCGAGQVCCAAFFQNSGYKQVKCANDCNQPLPGSTGVRLCDPDAPTDECDAIGKSCQPSQSLPGYYVCK